MNLRERAFDALERVESSSAWAMHAAAGEHLDARDANLVRTIVFGVLRWRGQLDWIIEQLSGRKAARLDRSVLQILRVGIYQLMFMDVPPYAAVAETMAVAAKRAARAKGLVNAVLRNATRVDLHALASTAPEAARHAHPEWIVARWKERFGANAAARILEADQELSYPDLLVNTTRIPMDDAEELLRGRGVSFERSTLAGGMLRLRESTAVVAEEIEQGLFYPMDEGSAVVASLVGGERILDLTAAPGGKSLAMLLRGADVVSCDRSLGRLSLLRESAPRMLGGPAKIVVADANRPPFLERFDSVLLDAPCSATGTFRKNPEIKWRLAEAQLAPFAVAQSEMLSAALEHADRECVYSTCSLEPEENDDVVTSVLECHHEFERFDLAARAEVQLQRWIHDGVLRLTPDSGADGFTAFGLRRRTSI